MATADLLVEQMFSWMEQREQCANKLKKLARELETLRGKSNVSQTVGSSVAVVGSACFIVAGLATLFTGGAAAPLLGVAGGVCTGVGVSVSLITKLTEHLMQSNTMKDAKKVESKVSKITKRIQRLFKQLKEECEQAGSFADPDDLDQHVMTEIVGAIARRSGLDPRFINRTSQWCSPHGGPGAVGMDMNMISLQPALLVGLAGVLTCFSLSGGGRASKILFAKGAELMIKEVKASKILIAKGVELMIKEVKASKILFVRRTELMIKEVSKTGAKTVLKGGVMAVGGAIGIAFELPEAIKHWKDLIKDNNVTEASKSLKDTADALRQLNRTLRAQLDKIKQTLEELDQVKCCTENSNRSSEQKKNVFKIC